MLVLNRGQGPAVSLGPECLWWDHGKTCQLVYSTKQDVSAVSVRQTQAQVNKHGQSHFAKQCLILRDEDACQLGIGAGCVCKVKE